MTAPTVDDRRAPVAPWGVTVVDVAVLTTDVTILDAVPTGVKPNSTVNITVGTVRAWIDEVSQLVSGSLGQYERIIDLDRRRIIEKAAKTVVVNGVGSYVEGAAHPTTATPNTTSYAQVLWARYKDGLLSLMGLIDRWVSAGGDGIGPVDTVTSGPAAWYFPPPMVRDWMNF